MAIATRKGNAPRQHTGSCTRIAEVRTLEEVAISDAAKIDGTIGTDDDAVTEHRDLMTEPKRRIAISVQPRLELESLDVATAVKNESIRCSFRKCLLSF